MTKQEFINRVLLIMNEASMADPAGTMFIGADTAQVDRQIEGSYVDAWRRCVKVMPRSWFKNNSFKNAGLVPNLAQGTGYVELPDDFYMLSSFKMQGWQKAAHEASMINDLVSSIQSNDYTRGSEIRPVCVIDLLEVSGTVKHVLRYYSLTKNLTTHVVEQAIYVPVVTPLGDIETTAELGLSDQVIEPLAYITASTVFTMHEKNNIAQALDARAVEMFPGLQSVKNGVTTVKQ
jgi:hypothetical protein